MKRKVHHKTVRKTVRPRKVQKVQRKTKHALTAEATAIEVRDASTAAIWHKREVATYQIRDIEAQLTELAQQAAALRLTKAHLDAVVEGCTTIINGR